MPKIPINGPLSLSQNIPNVDGRFGPYTSVAEANEYLGPAVNPTDEYDDVISAGMLFGVYEDDGSVTICMWTKDHATVNDFKRISHAQVVQFNGIVTGIVSINQSSGATAKTASDIKYLEQNKKFGYLQGSGYIVNWVNRYIWADASQNPYQDVLYLNIATNALYYYTGTTLVALTAGSQGSLVTSVNGQTGAVTITIPTKLSDLTNDVGFITNAGVTSFNGQTGAVTYTPPVTSVNNKTGAVVLSPSDIGLGNVDNTHDANKQVYSAVHDGSGNPIDETYETKTHATAQHSLLQSNIDSLANVAANLTGLEGTNFGGFSLAADAATAVSNIPTVFTQNGCTVGQPYWFLAGADMSALVAYRYIGSGTPAAISATEYDFTDFSGLSEQVKDFKDTIDEIGSIDSLFERASSPDGSLKLPYNFEVGKKYYLNFELSQSITFAITLRSANYASGPIVQTIAASKSYSVGKHTLQFTYLDGTFLRLGESAVWSSITNISIYNSINDVIPSIQKEVVEVLKVTDNFDDGIAEDEELKSVVGAYFNSQTEIDTSYTGYKAHYYKYNPLRKYKFTSTNTGSGTSHVFFVDEEDKVIGRAFQCSSTASTYTNESILDIPRLTVCIVLQTTATSSSYHLYHESKILKLRDNIVTTGKIADNSITKAKLGFVLNNTPSLGLGRLNNLFQFDGITEDGGTNIFPNGDGTSISPIVSRDSTFENPLGLKWVVTLTPKDALYNGAYYGSPYIGMNFYDHVTDKKKITFGYWVDTTISNYNPVVYINLDGSFIGVATLYFTTKDDDVVIKTVDGVYMATSKFVKYKYRGHDWAYCQIQLSIDATYDNTQLTICLQVKGGEDNIGKKYVFCGFVAINDLVELNEWTYYPSVDNLLYKVQELAQSSEIPTLSEAKIGTAGDSITEGAGLKADDDVIPDDDTFCPITGVKKKTFGYYIARELFAHWYNYGASGSTLGNVTARNSFKNGFSVSRYQNMSDYLTCITIWFGWNDAAYGPEMFIEEWIESQFGTRKAWTNNSSLFDTVCSGTLYYCSSEEHDAVAAYSEVIDGTTYTGTNAFVRKYIGTPTDSSNKTWWGAWNTVLPYLVAKYPNAKILVITGYGGNAAMWDAAIAAAKKYGVGYLDLAASGSMNFIQRRDTSAEANGQVYFDATKYTNRTYYAEYSSGNVTASEFRKRTLLYDACHPNTFGYQYLYKRIMQKMISI